MLLVKMKGRQYLIGVIKRPMCYIQATVQTRINMEAKYVILQKTVVDLFEG